MFDRAFERTLSYRLSAAYDCWGSRRSVRRGIRNGVWFLAAVGLDEPDRGSDDREDPPSSRLRLLAALRSSGLFTPIELATLDALVVERLTILEIAARDGCSRQAVMARLVGNSRGQGGILKKTRRYFSDVPSLNDGQVESHDENTAGREEPVRGADC